MQDFQLILFVLLGVIAIAVAIVWFIMTQPKGRDSVHVDFDHHKDRELNDRFVYKKR